MKKIIKRLAKQAVCKHDYEWYAESTLSNSHGKLDHELIIIDVECRKCGKMKEFRFKKELTK